MPTIVNLTNHSYFNLNGDGNILEHYFKIFSKEITEAENSYNIRGKFLNIENTVFDFREFAQLKERIKSGELEGTKGFDHGFKLDFDKKLQLAA